MNDATETFAREALAGWEKAANTMSAFTVRDPRTLAHGVGLLRAGLRWKNSVDITTAQLMAHATGQWMAPFANQPGVR